MKQWIKGLCPEIADWQAELIEEQMLRMLVVEREACAQTCDAEATIEGIAQRCAAAIRARNKNERS